MSDVFDKAFAMVIGVEGGYVNNPSDPGGETKFGITKRDHPNVDIKNLTLDGAKAIYTAEYWNPVKADMMPYPLSAYVFDAAVNQGVPTTVRLLQKSLGVAQDGTLGPSTMKAIQNQNPKELCAMFMADRALRYTGTRNFDIDGRGWLKRLFKIVLSGQ